MTPVGTNWTWHWLIGQSQSTPQQRLSPPHRLRRMRLLQQQQPLQYDMPLLPPACHKPLTHSAYRPSLTSTARCFCAALYVCFPANASRSSLGPAPGLPRGPMASLRHVGSAAIIIPAVDRLTMADHNLVILIPVRWQVIIPISDLNKSLNCFD